MDTPEPAQGTILLAHGSRDPLWREPIEAVARHIRLIAPAVSVRCAYLELSAPDLPSCVADMAAEGVGTITIVPMFLGLGRHVRADLPQQLAALRQSHPRIVFQLKPAIGEDAALIALMAQIAIS